MNAVLLVGDSHFIASVSAQVRGFNVLSTATATTVSDAIRLIEKALPDVVIAQARCLLEGSVLKTFGEGQSRSPYFIVIEEVNIPLLSATEPQRSAIAQQVVGHQPIALTVSTHYDTYTVIDRLVDLCIEKKVAVLEAGADAYVCLPLELPPKDRMTVAESELSPIVFRKSQQRLIQAYVHAGLTRAQRYRDLSRINDWLASVALVDPLTQLNNRRAFDLDLPHKIQAARAHQLPLSIMVLDIDHFKAVNDRHGHLVGDDVLRLLARRLQDNMRFYDKPFRYGGEEFVVMLGNTGLVEAGAIAHRLRQSIAEKAFKLERLAPVADESDRLTVTVSIGLAELRPDDDEQGRSFLHRADQYLLQAKVLGRNQVVSS